MKKNDYLERATNINENCFVSPALIIVRKNKTVKIAPDSRKLNEISVERKAKMHNLEEELTSRISKKMQTAQPTESGFYQNSIWTMQMGNYSY